MRKSLWLSSTVALTLGLAGTTVFAEPIEETMGQAYIQSTQLGGQRAQQRATDEQVPQALSNWRPTVTFNGSTTLSNTRNYPPNAGNGVYRGDALGESASVQVTQPLYRGGRTVAATSQATNAVKAGQAQLKATEQTVLLAAAQSYLDVVRDAATVDLTANNEAVLKRQLEAEEDRFRVGEVTRTDVALSQSSYQQARAQHQTAIGQLATDRANYQHVVGQAPGKLALPDFKYTLPATLDDAIADAESNNPNVIQAVFVERAARDGVDLTQGARLPTIQLVGTYTRVFSGNDPIRSSFGFSINNPKITDTGSVEAQVIWPLFTGGLTSSQVRESKQTANQRLIEIEEAKRVARQTAITAWQQLAASKANIESFTAQVEAAKIGAEGTRQQALVGTSTVLDSLTAEQNLLQAQVGLVGAQHDALVSSFTLLSAVGQMTAEGLKLNVPLYDPQVNQDSVHDKWFGTDIN